MVVDQNNFGAVQDAIDTGLQDGLVELHSDTLRTVIDNMEAGKDALGRSWEPVTSSTLRSREVRTSDPRPLVDTGTFRADIVSSSDVDASQFIGVIGTTMDIGLYHELGAPEAGIPRRPIFGPAAKYARRNAHIIERNVNRQLLSALL